MNCRPRTDVRRAYPGERTQGPGRPCPTCWPPSSSAGRGGPAGSAGPGELPACRGSRTRIRTRGCAGARRACRRRSAYRSHVLEEACPDGGTIRRHRRNGTGPVAVCLRAGPRQNTSSGALPRWTPEEEQGGGRRLGLHGMSTRQSEETAHAGRAGRGSSPSAAGLGATPASRRSKSTVRRWASSSEIRGDASSRCHSSVVSQWQ